MEHIIFDQLYFSIFKKKLEEQPYYGEKRVDYSVLYYLQTQH